MEYDAAPYQKEVRRQVTNLSAGFFSQNIYEGKMKKCYRFLQYYLIKGFLTILEGNYEICMKSQSNFW